MVHSSVGDGSNSGSRTITIGLNITIIINCVMPFKYPIFCVPFLARFFHCCVPISQCIFDIKSIFPFDQAIPLFYSMKIDKTQNNNRHTGAHRNIVIWRESQSGRTKNKIQMEKENYSFQYTYWVDEISTISINRIWRKRFQNVIFYVVDIVFAESCNIT